MELGTQKARQSSEGCARVTFYTLSSTINIHSLFLWLGTQQAHSDVGLHAHGVQYPRAVPKIPMHRKACVGRKKQEPIETQCGGKLISSGMRFKIYTVCIYIYMLYGGKDTNIYIYIYSIYIYIALPGFEPGSCACWAAGHQLNHRGGAQYWNQRVSVCRSFY